MPRLRCHLRAAKPEQFHLPTVCVASVQVRGSLPFAVSADIPLILLPIAARPFGRTQGSTTTILIFS